MRTVFLFAYLLSQADIDAGKADNLPAGSPIFVIDGNGVPTGKEYCSTGNSVPTEAVTSNNINTVLAAAGGAGWVKIQATVPNYTITKPATGAGLDLHIEAGSLAAITAIGWPVPEAGVDQLRIRNFSGQAQNFTAGAGWQIVTADGNPVTSGSYSIPDDRVVEITLDPNGFAQVVPWGGEVSIATFNAHTGNVSNPHAVTKAQVQLGNVDNISDPNKPVSIAQQTVFDTKEPKVTGKGLSTNDYTTVEKNKLAGVATGATANSTDAALLARANHTGAQATSTVTGLDTALTAREQTANRNAVNGYAGLDSSGKVAAAQLPSYVDDVIEVANLAALPGTGTSGIIYVTLDTNKPYRWSGSAYVEISPSPGSTDSVTEGSVNLYFTAARAKAAAVANAIADGVTDVAPSQNAVFDALAAKQATLVSGENLSSVNGLSLLGGGDITMASDLPGGTLTPVIDEGLATTGSLTPDYTTVPGQTIIRWNGAGNFTVPIGVTNVRALLVGGGGGGGGGEGVAAGDGGGGGGAGELLDQGSFVVVPGATLAISVGGGGAGANSLGGTNGANGTNGTNSTFGTLTARGGGGGGGNDLAANAGGSGGGGGGRCSSGVDLTGGAATAVSPGVGFAGGAGTGVCTNRDGAGGGGAGGIGGSSSGTGSAGIAGTGGAAVTSNITGALVTYAGGGGGGIGGGQGTAGAGGSANSVTVGGIGGASNDVGAVGAVNTGSGGGGGGARNGEGLPSGGAGGSGVIIIRFATQTRNYIALQSYVDNAAARAAGKLIGQFFKLTSTNAVMQVV